MPTQERAEQLGIVRGPTIVKSEWRHAGGRKWEARENKITLSAGDRRWPVTRFDDCDEELLAA